jgi:hypothetical protein
MNENNTPNGTVENVEEVVEEVVEESTEPLTIDDLLAIDEELFPEFKEENHKGMKPLHEWVKNVPGDVRKHLANMRSSYTRKTQELAEQRKELEQMKQELFATKERTVNNPMLQQIQQYATEEEHDIYTEDGMKAEIKRQASLMLQEMMKPAQEQIYAEKRQMELQRFKSEHPDLTSDDIRLPVAQLLTDRPELSLEDAYYIVKAKVETTKAKQLQEEASKVKQQRKDTLAKTSTGTANAPQGAPKFKDAWEAFQWHKQQNSKK